MLFVFVVCHLEGTPWAGWWLLVEHSESPMWKELMKDEIITQSCQRWHRE